jgi:catechol 2,3-dioxygenase-like lactoylglutathione lyase family enzyme
VLARRQFATIWGGAAAARVLRAEPVLTVAGIDHLKLRVANSGASTLFLDGLFGGQVVSLRNATFPDSPPRDEFLLHLGAQPGPYLMLATVRSGEQPGLDHLSLLAGPIAAARASLERAGVSLMKPDQHGAWFHDPDGGLIELIYPPPRTTSLGPDPRLPIPAHLRDLRPAFEPAAITRVRLGSPNLATAAEFYSRVVAASTIVFPPTFPCGATALELRNGAPGLDRLVIGIQGFTPETARRILTDRGITPYGAPHEVLFRDPDGNELQLVAP